MPDRRGLRLESREERIMRKLLIILMLGAFGVAMLPSVPVHAGTTVQLVKKHHCRHHHRHHKKPA
jgi:hypothetical protein